MASPVDATAENFKISVANVKKTYAVLAEPEKALKADRSKFDPNLPAPSNLFYMLGLTTEDGWAPPKPQPGADFNEELRKAFAKWLDGPGKDYRINKMVKKK